MEILHPRHRDSTTNHMESAPPAPLPGGLDMLSALIDANIRSPRPRLDAISLPKPTAQAARASTTDPPHGDVAVDIDPFATDPSTTDPPHGDVAVDIDPFATHLLTTDPLHGNFRVDDTDETPLFRLVQSVWPGAA